MTLGNIGIDDQAIYDPQMISHLLGYGIIEDNQGVLDFKIEVLKNYLNRKYAYKRQNMTNEEKLSADFLAKIGIALLYIALVTNTGFCILPSIMYLLIALQKCLIKYG